MTSPEVIFTICRRTIASPYHIFKSLLLSSMKVEVVITVTVAVAAVTVTITVAVTATARNDQLTHQFRAGMLRNLLK